QVGYFSRETTHEDNRCVYHARFVIPSARGPVGHRVGLPEISEDGNGRFIRVVPNGLTLAGEGTGSTADRFGAYGGISQPSEDFTNSSSRGRPLGETKDFHSAISRRRRSI